MNLHEIIQLFIRTGRINLLEKHASSLYSLKPREAFCRKLWLSSRTPRLYARGLNLVINHGVKIRNFEYTIILHRRAIKALLRADAQKVSLNLLQQLENDLYGAIKVYNNLIELDCPVTYEIYNQILEKTTKCHKKAFEVVMRHFIRSRDTSGLLLGHKIAQQNEIDLDRDIMESIISAYRISGSYKESLALLDKNVSFGEIGQLVATVARNEGFESVWSLLQKMRLRSVLNQQEYLDSDCFSQAIWELGRRGDFNGAEQILRFMRMEGMTVPVRAWNGLVAAYSVANKCLEAEITVENMPILPTAHTLRYLIRAQPVRAKSLLSLYKIEPSEIALGGMARDMDFDDSCKLLFSLPSFSVHSANQLLLRCTNTNQALQIVKKMAALNIRPNRITEHALVLLYSRCADHKGAEQIFSVFESYRRHFSSMYVYAPLMEAYITAGMPDEAAAVIRRAKLQSTKLSDTAWRVLQRIYISAGEYEQALATFRGNAPELIRLLGLCNKLEEAQQVHSQHRSQHTFHSLIAAYLKRKKVSHARQLYSEMAADYQLDSISYSLLMRIYALSGDVAAVEKITAEMRAENIELDRIHLTVWLEACAQAKKYVNWDVIKEKFADLGLDPSALVWVLRTQSNFDEKLRIWMEVEEAIHSSRAWAIIVNSATKPAAAEKIMELWDFVKDKLDSRAIHQTSAMLVRLGHRKLALEVVKDLHFIHPWLKNILQL